MYETLRVGVVQIDYWPAYMDGNGNYFELPIDYKPNVESNTATIETRRAIRELRVEQIKIKIKAIVDECKRLNVSLLVFPEYSIPIDIIGYVKTQASNMTIVCGTHRVNSLDLDFYEQLGFKRPSKGTAVAPVFSNEQAVLLQAKLFPCPAEKETNRPLEAGTGWDTFSVNNALCGVLICNDFLSRDIGIKDSNGLDKLNILVVPTRTSNTSVTNLFEQGSTSITQGFHSHVLLSNDATFGKTTVFSPSNRRNDVKNTLIDEISQGEEALLVVDLNLSRQLPGASTQVNAEPASIQVTIIPIMYETNEIHHKFINIVDKSQSIMTQKGFTKGALSEISVLSNTIRRDEIKIIGLAVKKQLSILEDISSYIDKSDQFENFVRVIALPSPCLKKSMHDIVTKSIFDNKEVPIPKEASQDERDLIEKLKNIKFIDQTTPSPNRTAYPINAAKGITERIRALIEERPFNYNDSQFSLPKHDIPSKAADACRSEAAYYLAATEIITGNPSDNTRREAYKDTFVMPRIIDKEGGSAVDRIINALSIKGYTSLLLGERGCGKSTLLNYILTTMPPELQKKKVAWFRSDIAKLYEIISDINKDDTQNDIIRFSIINYYAIHCIWVCMLYSGNHPDVGKDPSLLSLAPYFALSKDRRNLIDDEPKRRIFSEIMEMCVVKANELHAFHPHKGGHPKDLSRLFVKEILIGLYQINISGIISLDEICRSILRAIHFKLNSAGWTVAHIIDGVDNIPIPRLGVSLKPSLEEGRTITYYEFILNQLLRHIARETNELGGYDSLLISMREDTWRDLKAIHRSSSVRRVRNISILNTPEIRIEAGNIEEIVKVKIAKANEPHLNESNISGYWKGIADRHPLQPYENRPRGEVATITNYVRNILFQKAHIDRIKALSHYRHDDELSTMNNNAQIILKHLFNGNVRSLMRNSVQTCLYASRMYRANSIEHANEDNIKEYLLPRDYIAREGSILAGQPLLPEQNEASNSDVPGDWCPCLFYGIPEDNQSYWPGLVLLRVLQIIRGATKDSCIKQYATPALIAKLTILFGYTERAIENALKRAYAYALVKNTDDVKIVENVAVPIIELTIKGELIIALAFEVPEVTYYMALRSPFSSTIWRNDRLQDNRAFECHNLSLDSNLAMRRWFHSLTKTSITMMRHITHFHQKEMEQLLKNGKSVANDFGIPQKSLENWFALPSRTKWFRSLAIQLSRGGYYRGGHRGEKYKRIDILKEMEDVIPQVTGYTNL